jgi:hypothetical protein
MQLVPGKTAASFQLQAVVELVKGSEVADAPALETKINDPEAKLNAIDLDDDGVTDFVEVIEEKQGGKTTLEFRAIPSSKQGKPAEVGVSIATVSFEIEDETKIIVHGAYSGHIEHDVELHVYHHEEPVVYEHGLLVVPAGCFFHYVFLHEHDPYHGHFHYVVIDTHVDTHVDAHVDVHVHKHKKHKKHKHKKHKGHGRGHGGVVVTF